jgi:hypothetical protein
VNLPQSQDEQHGTRPVRGMMRSATVAGQTTRVMALRDEALLMLDRRGAVLDIARQVSQLMRTAGIPGVVIGGVAVVLHGHVRTTRDIDIFLPPPSRALRRAVDRSWVYIRPSEERIRQAGGAGPACAPGTGWGTLVGLRREALRQSCTRTDELLMAIITGQLREFGLRDIEIQDHTSSRAWISGETSRGSTAA